MTDIFTASITVFTGVSICIIGLLVQKLVIDPFIEQREAINAIKHSLILYASICNNPTSGTPEETKKAGETFLDLSATLRSKTDKIFKYSLLTKLHLVVDEANIQKTCHHLIFLSNAIGNQNALQPSIFQMTITLPDEIRALLELPG